MKPFLSALIFCVLLSGCGGAKVARLYHPQSGHIVKCSGSAKLPNVVEVNRCIYDHEELGYERRP